MKVIIIIIFITVIIPAFIRVILSNVLVIISSCHCSVDQVNLLTLLYCIYIFFAVYLAEVFAFLSVFCYEAVLLCPE